MPTSIILEVTSTKRIRYSKDVLKKVNHAWLEYKAKTGVTQTQAAKVPGIKQSALSQYLRGPEKGGIPLNTDFLAKFAEMVQMDLTEFGLILELKGRYLMLVL